MCYNSFMSTYKGFTPARAKANDKYLTEKVDNISLHVPKGQKEVIRNAAQAQGVSMNQYIVEAINARLQSDQGT